MPSPPPPPAGDLEGIPYNPVPYTIMKPAHFPAVPVPVDNPATPEDESNPMTQQGVQLGRRLFYDPILSGDSTFACASCHHVDRSFTDIRTFSIGIDSIEGRRNSMSLLNVAYSLNGLFWDGRSPSLEDQALHPVEDVIELHATWADVVIRLQNHPTYPTLFRQAFGISDRIEISKELVGKALAQFERILISSGNSKYDRWLKATAAEQQGETIFDEDEKLGRIIFFDEGTALGFPDAQCFHCHSDAVTLNGGNYFNNGLDAVATLEDFKDKGRGEVTGNPTDNGKFRAPTLRNITLTAPYMHDGRFATLEEVINHYGDGAGTGVINEDPFISQIGKAVGNKHILAPEFKAALLKFLKTLDDPDFINNPDIKSPF